MTFIEEKEKRKKFESFFVSNYPKVKMFAWKLLKSENDAEDIAQDVFVSLWSIPEIWDDGENKDAYIFTIARNRIYNFIKHKSIEYSYKESYIQDSDILKGVDGYDPIYAKEFELLIKLSISKMPDQRRKIFLMSRYDNLTNLEISDCLGLSIRTVERHIYLALLDLKKIILILHLFLFIKHL